MEAYVLDANRVRDQVVDMFESFIWTERFAQWGDFELHIQATPATRSLLTAGTKLAMNKSNRMMMVETITDKQNSDGKVVLEVKGRSVEALLEDRTAANAAAATAPWVINLAPAAVARKIFTDICITGKLSPYDILDDVVASRMPGINASTITEPIDPIIWSQPPQSVYQALSELCNTWVMGFRMLRYDVDKKLYFDVYTGKNRTTRQTTNNPVVFAPELDNLQNTSEFSTVEGFKNVAQVFTPNGYLEVILAEIPPDSDDFDRRVLAVVADDITLPYGTAPGGVPDAARTAFIAAATQRGKEELAKCRAVQAFDGEIRQNSQYLYGIHYDLGDVVEQRNGSGMANDMRVTEQIFVHDKEGERSYPTLELNQFINTGSWLSWETGKKWADYSADVTTFWSTLP